MSGNLLVINVDFRETRVALIEEGIIAELHIERHTSRSTLGNVYLGTVSRVLPGMQAAFIDIGQERAAFLHVEDLIRPDDFDAYLAGSRQAVGAPEEGAEPAEGEADEAEPDAAEASSPKKGKRSKRAKAGPARGKGRKQTVKPRHSEDTASLEDNLDLDLPKVTIEPYPMDPPSASASDASALEEEEADDEPDSRPPPDDEPDSQPPSDDEPGPPDSSASAEPDVVDSPAASELDGDDCPPAEAKASPAAGAPVESPPESDDSSAPDAEQEKTDGEDLPPVQKPVRRRRRKAMRARVPRSGRSNRSKRSAKTSGGESKSTSQSSSSRGRSPRRRSHGSSGKCKANESRISKSTPIREVVREGQQVVVQVSKEPIGTKGARVTSHVSLPGRYVVYIPTVEHVGISKRIGADKERARLRDAIESVKPPTGGLVVRTVAEGLTKKKLKTDVGYLVRLWEQVSRAREESTKAPDLLYEELDLVLKTARDLFTEDVDRIVIDNREQYGRLRRFVEMFMPERVDCIELYEGREPVFDAYGIEDEIGRALSRKVPLASGGHLVIDQAEALTAIDVNTGRFVGKGSKDLEDTILQANLEAVEEIAYQLRFRNIGGLIILDLIDMEKASNREKVRRRLDALLAKDKAKTTLNRISNLGLIEMTRKRTRESLGRLMHEPCFYCDGTGQLQSKQTIAYEILRQIRRESANLKGFRITINAHPAVIDLLKFEEAEAVQEVERIFTRRIELVAKGEYHIEQFDLQGL